MNDSKRFESTYAEYNKILRTWFVAFGVGVPGALVLSEESRSLLAQTENPKCIVIALAIGVVLQVFIAMLNKYIAWCNSFIELHIIDDSNIEEDYKSLKQKYPKIYFVSCLTNLIWIDLIVDLVTSILFGYAIWKILISII